MSGKELYVGIDVSNAKLDVDFIDAESRTVRPPATFTNDPEGWTGLRTAVVSAARLVGRRARIVCGMEATSNMHKRVEQALRNETRRKLEVHVLNPRAVKNFRKALLKSSKTDRVDSHLIALFLLRMQPAPPAVMPELFEEFREATRTRRRLIEERTIAKNRLHKLLRYHFPGYRKVVGRQLTKGLLVAMIEMPSPHAILELPVDELAKIRKGPSHRIGSAFAKRLHILACQAPSQRLQKITQMLIRTTAQRIVDLNRVLADMDRGIQDMLDELFPDQVLTSMPGLGKVSVAAILAEVGDINRFANSTQFVGYCGLYPVVWESGDAKRRYRMTGKGNRMLKMTLLIASAAARQYNPVIATFYERLRRRGKSKKAAGGAIARKMAELVFALLIRGERWSPEKAMLGMQKAETMLAYGA